MQATELTMTLISSKETYWKGNREPTELTGGRRTRQDARKARPDTRNQGQGRVQPLSCALIPFDTCCHYNLAAAFISAIATETHSTEAYLKIRGVAEC